MTASPWGREDRALMLALQMYRRTLCPGCGNPKDTAWHVDTAGHWEVKAEYTCQPCSVRAEHDVTFTVVADTRDYETDPLHGHYTDFGSVDGSVAAAAAPPAPPRPFANESSLSG